MEEKELICMSGKLQSASKVNRKVLSRKYMQAASSDCIVHSKLVDMALGKPNQ